MSDARWLPPAQATQARAFAAAGRAPAEAQPASTVVLLRDGARGVEVYVHVRHKGMAFAAGMLAFPGGRVDPIDLTTPVTGDGDRLLGTGPGAAGGFVAAALRETHEETGVRLRADDLVPWAHWITPRFEPRRYDTWFFLAALPEDQEPADVSGEADSVAWVRPTDALDRAARGEWLMLPPTTAVLTEMQTPGSVSAALTAADERTIEVIVPGWIDDGDRIRAVLPGDDGYPGDDRGDRR